MLQQNVAEIFWTISSERKGEMLVLYDNTMEHLEILARTLDLADMIFTY